MELSVELIPRNEQSIQDESALIKKRYNEVTAINVPDLMQFNLRSYDAVQITKQHIRRGIPHLRAIDFDLNDQEKLESILQNQSEVLVVKGDIPQDARRIYATTSVELIHAIKASKPQIKVYAAIDQNRTSFKEELDYVKQKQDAGADGFFTQPFFNPHFLELYANQIRDTQVYWGISPVLSQKSQSYWEVKNNTVFPKDFEPTFDWNIKLGKSILEVAEQKGDNVYLMPIKVDLTKYLNAVLS